MMKNDRDITITMKTYEVSVRLRCIDSEVGNELSNQEVILNRSKEFHENLYSSNKPTEEVKQATSK